MPVTVKMDHGLAIRKMLLRGRVGRRDESSYSAPFPFGGWAGGGGDSLSQRAGMAVTEPGRKAFLRIWALLLVFFLKTLKLKCWLTPFGGV